MDYKLTSSFTLSPFYVSVKIGAYFHPDLEFCYDESFESFGINGKDAVTSFGLIKVDLYICDIIGSNMRLVPITVNKVLRNGDYTLLNCQTFGYLNLSIIFLVETYLVQLT